MLIEKVLQPLWKQLSHKITLLKALSREVEHSYIQWPSSSTSSVYPRESGIYASGHIHRNAQCTIKIGINLSTEKWISELYYRHTMDCYTAVKMNTIQLHATTWIIVSGIMLSEKASLRRLHQLCYLSRKWKIKTMNSL